MGVKEDIQYIEQEIAVFRENKKNLQKEGTPEQKLLLYENILKKIKSLIRLMKIRLFVLGFFNKELKRKLYSVYDIILKGNELLQESYEMLSRHEHGEDENVLEFTITAKQLEKKIKALDEQILEKAKLLHEAYQHPLYKEIGAMLTLRMVATLFVLLEKETESTAVLVEKMEKMERLKTDNTNSPLHHKNRHRPTNKLFPL